MQTRNNRRPRGTGRIFQKHGNWYGQWHGLTRKLGPVREPGSRQGLTRAMAEARLRERMSETSKAPPSVAERTTVGDAGRVRIKELARKGRKVDTTLANYESEIRVHFEPHFGQAPIAQLDADDVEAFLDACFNAGLAAKTVRNLYTHLSGIFEFARRKRWTHANPCREVEKPASDQMTPAGRSDSSIRQSSTRCLRTGDRVVIRRPRSSGALARERFGRAI